MLPLWVEEASKLYVWAGVWVPKPMFLELSTVKSPPPSPGFWPKPGPRKARAGEERRKKSARANDTRLTLIQGFVNLVLRKNFPFMVCILPRLHNKLSAYLFSPWAKVPTAKGVRPALWYAKTRQHLLIRLGGKIHVHRGDKNIVCTPIGEKLQTHDVSFRNDKLARRVSVAGCDDGVHAKRFTALRVRHNLNHLLRRGFLRFLRNFLGETSRLFRYNLASLAWPFPGKNALHTAAPQESNRNPAPL